MRKEETRIEMEDEELWKMGFARRMYDLVAPFMTEEGTIPYSSLADAIGIDAKLLKNYLQGKNVPTATKLMKIADFFGVTADYLLYGWNLHLRFSAATISQLGVLVRDSKISLNKMDSTRERLSIHVEDKHLTMILKELLISKGCSDYDDVISTLTRVYNGFIGFNGELVDYAAFRNLVRQEYLYQYIDPENVFYFEDGSEGLQGYDFDYLIERSEEWELLSETEREAWWELYSANEFAQADYYAKRANARLAQKKQQEEA